MELASVPIHFSEQIKYFKSGIAVTILPFRGVFVFLYFKLDYCCVLVCCPDCIKEVTFGQMKLHL